MTSGDIVWNSAQSLFIHVVTSGDMVWNSAQSLFIHSDGGVHVTTHPNPAPLTNLLFVAAYGPAATPSLATVLGANAVVIALLALAARLCSGLYLARRAEGTRPFVLFWLGAPVAWIPYTGVLLGGVISFGHVNLLASYLVLWLAWIIFGETHLGTLARPGLLLAIATGVASSWAPLVIVPVALAVAAGTEGLRRLRKLSGRAGGLA